MNRIRCGIFGALLLIGMVAVQAEVQAGERIAGVELPSQAAIGDANTPLLLNGAGIRKKFFFKIYIGALYLPEKSVSAERILASDGPYRVLMHFLYSKVSAEDLAEAWRDGFKANLDDAQLQALRPEIDRFVALFGDLVEGDRVLLDYLPAVGTRVTINDKLAGTIPGPAFGRALLRIWLGDEPVTEALKEAMLGVE